MGRTMPLEECLKVGPDFFICLRPFQPALWPPGPPCSHAKPHCLCSPLCPSTHNLLPSSEAWCRRHCSKAHPSPVLPSSCLVFCLPC